jgi:uncharacterized protein YjiS (DUF1127 family)
MAIDLRLRFPERSLERARPGVPARTLGALRRAVNVAMRWYELRRQRRALLELSDQMLKDIGISRADAIREASRPFWDTGVDGWGGWR